MESDYTPQTPLEVARAAVRADLGHRSRLNRDAVLRLQGVALAAHNRATGEGVRWSRLPDRLRVDLDWVVVDECNRKLMEWTR